MTYPHRGYRVTELSLADLIEVYRLRQLLDPLMGETLPLVTLFGAIAVAVWLGGYGPAVLVAALGYAACAYLFIEPRGHIDLSETKNLVGFVAYGFTASIIIVFGQLLLQARQQLLIGLWTKLNGRFVRSAVQQVGVNQLNGPDPVIC